MTADEVCAERVTPAGIELRLLAGDADNSEPPLLLVSGTPGALRFLAGLLVAVAEDDALPASFQMSPNGSGQFHLSAASDMGVYIQCVPES